MSICFEWILLLKNATEIFRSSFACQFLFWKMLSSLRQMPTLMQQWTNNWQCQNSSNFWDAYFSPHASKSFQSGGTGGLPNLLMASVVPLSNLASTCRVGHLKILRKHFDTPTHHYQTTMIASMISGRWFLHSTATTKKIISPDGFHASTKAWLTGWTSTVPGGCVFQGNHIPLETIITQSAMEIYCMGHQ